MEVAIKIRADAIRLNALGKPDDDWIMSAHAQIVIYTLLLFTCFYGKTCHLCILFVKASGAGPPLEQLNFTPKSFSGPPGSFSLTFSIFSSM